MGFLQTDARPIFHQTAGTLIATVLTVAGAALISALAARSYYLMQQPFYKAVVLAVIVFLGIALSCLLFALTINVVRRRSDPRLVDPQAAQTDADTSDIALDRSDNKSAITKIALLAISLIHIATK